MTYRIRMTKQQWKRDDNKVAHAIDSDKKKQHQHDWKCHNELGKKLWMNSEAIAIEQITI